MAATCDDQVKIEWPELVGKPGDIAKKIIEKENPCLRQVLIILEGTGTDKAFFQDRVRVWVNGRNVVTRVPRVG
ncbi:hypothetical protein MKX03_020201 [Papaver bracteatum]|nr:hypothetical protein MKX03_020201 [Papaver bracteatum]